MASGPRPSAPSPPGDPEAEAWTGMEHRTQLLDVCVASRSVADRPAPWAGPSRGREAGSRATSSITPKSRCTEGGGVGNGYFSK